MEVKYTIQAREYKEYFKDSKRVINFFSIVSFIILYIIFNYSFLILNPLFSLFILFLCVITLIILIKVIDKILVKSFIKQDKKNKTLIGHHLCIIDEEGIVDEIKGNKLKIKWKSVRRIKISDNYIRIIPVTGRVGFTYSKKFLSDEEYNKIKSSIIKYSNIYQHQK